MNIFVEGKKIELDEKCSGFDLAIKLNLTSPTDAIAMLVNDEPKDLQYPLKNNDKVSFLSFNDKDGQEIFWHSSAHILAQAVKRLYPEANPTIGPAIESGFYYDFANLKISEEDLPKIEKEAKKIISEALKPIRIEY